MSYVDDDEVVQKAISRFFRDCEADGLIASQPSIGSCSVDDGIVELRNMRGVLARYRHAVDSDGRARFERLAIEDDSDE